MLGNVYKKIPAISADIKAKEKPGLGLRYEKDSAANACIFIQTKEKSPNANCVQTQSGAGGGTRTHTPLRITDFESVSSANSDTPAFIFLSRLPMSCPRNRRDIVEGH